MWSAFDIFDDKPGVKTVVKHALRSRFLVIILQVRLN